MSRMGMGENGVIPDSNALMDSKSSLFNLRRVTATDDALRPKLRALLADAVDHGASVGFLAPLKTELADRYWDGVFASLGSGRALWIAEEGGEVVGSVQLELCAKENGLHRAEVQKL